MPKQVTITVNEDELEVLDTIYKTVDFYGDGYDEGLVSDRDSSEAFNDFYERLRKAYQEA